jgi:hypothetical protein
MFRLEKVLRKNLLNSQQKESIDLSNLIERFIQEKQKNPLLCVMKNN